MHHLHLHLHLHLASCILLSSCFIFILHLASCIFTLHLASCILHLHHHLHLHLHLHLASCISISIIHLHLHLQASKGRDDFGRIIINSVSSSSPGVMFHKWGKGSPPTSSCQSSARRCHASGLVLASIMSDHAFSCCQLFQQNLECQTRRKLGIRDERPRTFKGPCIRIAPQGFRRGAIWFRA